MRIFLMINDLKYKDFEEALKNNNKVETVGILFIGKDKHFKNYSDWLSEKKTLPLWTDTELIDTGTYVERTPYHDQYEKILSDILADSRTYFLAERLFSHLGESSVFNSVITIETIIWNSLAILYHSKPDCIIGGTIPHEISWFFAKVAELMGLEVYLHQYSPLQWKKWIVKNMEQQTPVPIEHIEKQTNEMSMKKINEYISKIRSSYEVGMPKDETGRKRKKYNDFFCVQKEFCKNIKTSSPTIMLYRSYVSLRKKQTLDLYYRHTKNFHYPDKFISFFLHYQPEATTLPEGYQYAQQWLAIRVLAESIPKDWRLVVKEHPGTYNLNFDPRVRDKKLYNAICALPNALLAPLELDPFELIDNSMAVSTITGTVGLEAVIRGKPVLVFGAAQYRGIKGVFSIQSASDIITTISQIEDGFRMPTDNELLQYFEWVDNNSVNVDLEWLNSNLTENKQLMEGTLKLFSLLLKNISANK